MKSMILDIETTGVSAKTDKILEIAGGIMDSKEDVYAPLSDPWRILVVHESNLSVPLRVLSMHSKTGLWQLLSSMDDDMNKTKKDVIKLYEREGVDKNVKTMAVRPKMLFPIFKSMMGERLPKDSTSKRFTLGGKNVSFDLSFLVKANPKIAEFFRTRQIDPGMLWINESDDVPPSLPECLERCGKAYPGMPATLAHSALDDSTATAWVIRGGIRRLLSR